MKWHPIADIPDGAHRWPSELYRNALQRWRNVSKRLAEPGTDRTALELWTRERKRLMAIETGQIEDLYTIRRGITEQLITEGLQHAVASHTIERGLSDETFRGLLRDQETALDLVFYTVKERPLSEAVIKEWHALLTRHQELAPARDSQGRRTGIPFVKGAYKRRPNNPRRPDGTVHEYCPPEQTASEMERLLAMHHRHEATNPLPTPVEAAWLHHRFIQIHPFEDGNGRTARLLMSFVYVKRGEPPPVVTAAEKSEYILALEAADAGNLGRFARYLELKSIQTMDTGNDLAQASLEVAGRFHHRNGDLSTQNGHKDWTHHRAPENEEVLKGWTRADADASKASPRHAPGRKGESIARHLRGEIERWREERDGPGGRTGTRLIALENADSETAREAGNILRALRDEWEGGNRNKQEMLERLEMQATRREREGKAQEGTKQEGRQGRKRARPGKA